MVNSILIITANYQKKRRVPCQNFIEKQLLLAQNLPSNMCATLINFLKEIINSKHFINRHRQSPTDFVRQRKLPFSTLIFFLINFVKGSYQDELDHFFKAIHCLDVARNFVSKAALAGCEVTWDNFEDESDFKKLSFQFTGGDMRWLLFHKAAYGQRETLKDKIPNNWLNS